MTRVKVVVVDDHEIVRRGLISILEREEDLTVVGEAASGEAALPIVAAASPDVVIVDHGLPGMSGVALCEQLTDLHPGLPTIILTTIMRDEVVRGALAAGARAFVIKDIDGDDLKRAIRAVARGEAVLDPKVAGRVAAWADSVPPRDPATLSEREVEVLRLVANGKTNLEISVTLHLSNNTVRTYLKRANAKLSTRTRGEAAVAAARRGVL